MTVPPATDASEQLTPVQSTRPFDDLATVTTWAEPQILKLYKLVVISGDGNGKFRPNDNITREEFVKIVVEAFDIENEGSNNFDDVDSDSWYSPYINKAVSANIINGVGNDLFGVGKNITREDMATIVCRVLSKKGHFAEMDNVVSFDDADDISQYAIDAVNTLVSAGVLKGVGENRFSPKDSATRAMVAVMICNALEICQ